MLSKAIPTTSINSLLRELKKPSKYSVRIEQYVLLCWTYLRRSTAKCLRTSSGRFSSSENFESDLKTS